MAHIEIENLTFSYPSAGRPSLSDVSLTIRRGEYVVLCGKSGSGKTTLLRHLKTAVSYTHLRAHETPELGDVYKRQRYESAGSGREGGLRHAESGRSDRDGQGLA